MNRGVRRGAAFAALVVAVLVLSSCLAVPREIRTTPTPDVSGVSEELLPYYSQSIRWTPCDGAECAQVDVPLDWSEPGAAAISLALIRRNATGADPLGSLLVNPGGPGASGVELVRDAVSSAATTALRERYDLVGFDPRGVGDSTAVSCLDAADMDAYLFDIRPGERGSAEWQAAVDARNRAFGEACDAASDGLLPYVTTTNAARDLDVIRAVLGEEKLDYLGYSYGTLLGATYAELHPDRVGRFVLDGAVDPAADSIDVSVEQAVGFESSLRAYLANCLGASGCPFSGSVDEALQSVSTLLRSVDRAPLVNADGRLLGADTLLTAIIAALYSQTSWPALSQALARALEGSPAVAFQLADFYYARQGGQYADNSAEAFRAYNCADYPVVEAADERAAAERLAVEAPTVAPYWLGRDPCLVWPHPASGDPHTITAEGAPPILVVGTTNDPATPYRWSEQLASDLASGVLITRVGEGHTGFNKGNVCVNSAVEDFFLTGQVPDDGLRC